MRSTRALGRAALEHARTGGPDISAGATGFLTLLRAGFAEPTGSPRPLVVSCTTVSPLPAPTEVDAGGLFSVALSRGSPRVGVAHRPALRSPDLPRPPRSPEGNAVARPAPPHGQRSGDSGFEARRWRSSHLNHRSVGGAPRTSTTDRSVALLAPQPPIGRWRFSHLNHRCARRPGRSLPVGGIGPASRETQTQPRAIS